MKQYDLRYEEGKCAMGYEWVPGHFSRGVEVQGFCRKIPEHRFFNPDVALKRQEMREYQEIRKILLRDPERFVGEEEL